MAKAFRKSGLITCAVSVVGLCLAGPGAAAASASFDSSSIMFNSSHGYDIRIVGNNQPFGTGNFVGLTTHKGHAYSSYNVGGTSTAKALKADLGSFGKIDLTFHPENTVHPPLPGPHCHGVYKRTVGVWKGTIKFTGENGYTTVSAKSEEGNHVVNSVTCHGGGGTPHKHVHLLAQTSGATFNADVSKKSGAQPTFSTFVTGFSDPVSIYRTASVHGAPQNFSYNPGYTHATVKPPAPFSGMGTFDSPSSWTGTLKVDLPGAPNTVIAGSGWSASLGEQSRSALVPLATPFGLPTWGR